MAYVRKGNTIQINEARLEGYAYGCTETWLEDLAKSHNISPDGLANRVATALLAMGQRSQSEVRSVRKNTSTVHRPVESVEVGGNARSGSTSHRIISAGGKRRIKAAQQARWKKFRAEKRAAELEHTKIIKKVKASAKRATSPYSKKHPHWTQMKKNKGKLARVLKVALKARHAQAA